MVDCRFYNPLTLIFCSIPIILSALAPYKKNIVDIGIEATYNWYWIVDGLRDADYNVRLAHLLRINNFPDAYIYPKEERPLRDLMRKRSLLVRTRTQYMLSFINLVSRNRGIKIGGNKVKQLSDQEVEEGSKNSVNHKKIKNKRRKLWLENQDQLVKGQQVIPSH